MKAQRSRLTVMVSDLLGFASRARCYVVPLAQNTRDQQSFTLARKLSRRPHHRRRVRLPPPMKSHPVPQNTFQADSQAHCARYQRHRIELFFLAPRAVQGPTDASTINASHRTMSCQTPIVPAPKVSLRLTGVRLLLFRSLVPLTTTEICTLPYGLIIPLSSLTVTARP
jgi:hypothetical protein